MAGKTSGESGTTSTTAKTDAVVEYTGSADEVKISASDWNKAGVEGDQKQVVWNRANRFKVPAGDLSAEALEVLRTDSRFKVPEA